MNAKTHAKRSLGNVLQTKETVWVRVVEMEACHTQVVHAGENKTSGEGTVLAGPAWVELPASLADKLRKATRTTGLSLDSLVYDAVDFYLEERIYNWVVQGVGSRGLHNEDRH